MSGRTATLARVVTVILVGMFPACGGEADTSVTGPTPIAPPEATPPGPAGAGNALLRVRCEARAGRSRISVDGKNLASGMYRTTVRSGGNSVRSQPRAAVGGEVEFDFDSNTNDVAAGAARIAADFIQGSRVEATLASTSGQVIANTVASCSWQ